MIKSSEEHDFNSPCGAYGACSGAGHSPKFSGASITGTRLWISAIRYVLASIKP